MDWLNYQHLQYFWTTAREGSLKAAAARLRLSPSTLSSQIRALEDQLGHTLFDRSGRTLRLTESGRVAMAHADRVFGAGRELVAALDGQKEQAQVVRFGVASSLPAPALASLLAPLLKNRPAIVPTLERAAPPALFASLAAGALDAILTDDAIAGATSQRAFNHIAMDLPVGFWASAESEAARSSAGFPEALVDAARVARPLDSGLRRHVDHWLDDARLRLPVAAEAADDALLVSLAARGAGVYAGPLHDALPAPSGLTLLGVVPEVRFRIYAITLDRRVRAPSVRMMIEAARARFTSD